MKKGKAWETQSDDWVFFYAARANCIHPKTYPKSCTCKSSLKKNH